LLYEHPYLTAGSTAEFVQIVRDFIRDKSFFRQGQDISKQLLEQFDEETIRKKLIGIYTDLYRNSVSR